MVGYNQNQPNVWGSFAGGLEIGGALRRRDQQDAYGEAYQQSGFEGVRDAAGGFGDIQTAQSAQGTLDEQEETALARATRSATVMANAASSLQGVPYEQRWQMIDRMEPMLEPLGISPEQLRQFDPTDENLAMIMSMPSQFEQFTEIRETDDGALVGITRNGQPQVLREAPPPAWQQIPQDQLPAGARFGQRNTRTGEADIDWATGGGGAGGVLPGALAPYQFNPDGTLRPIEGGPADLRQTAEGQARIDRLASSERQLETGISALNQVLGFEAGNLDQDATPAANTGSISGATAGVWANRTREWGFNQGAVDLDRALDPVRAILSFENLAEMRRNSEGGGALGSIAVRELELLSATVRSLAVDQGPEQLRANVLEVRRQLIRTQQAVAAARAELQGGGQAQAPAVNNGTDAPQPRVRIWNPNTGRLE